MGNTNLTEALAKAGSPTPDAGSYIEINRRPRDVPAGTDPATVAKPAPERVSMADLQSGRAQSIILSDGDTVFVPKAETFFVTGYVKNGGPFLHDAGDDGLEGDLDGRRRVGEGLAQPHPHHPARQRQAGRGQGREAGRPGAAGRLQSKSCPASGRRAQRAGARPVDVVTHALRPDPHECASCTSRAAGSSAASSRCW